MRGGQHLCTPLGVERTLGVLGSNLLRGSPTCHLQLPGAPGVAPDVQQSSIVSRRPGLWFKAHGLPPSRKATSPYWLRHQHPRAAHARGLVAELHKQGQEQAQHRAS